ncbi:MAG TPA: type III pantothenate kinase [Bacteroidales bacterium]|nr:type III pantothenate kinase [Bacteroidales bacterium]HPS71832.1 type III pantothenate kinase [Bacteroidales bacterium]
MNLVIDIGNSLQKWALFDQSDQMVFVTSVPKITLESLQDLFKKYNIEKSIISSVGKLDSNVESFIRQSTQLIPFTHQSKLPISIHYLQAETLGLDRIANSVAAATLFPNQNCISIQAGSCIVYDFVNKNGEFLGGAISPGLQMRFKSLHDYTARLPLEDFENIDYFLGQSTQQSIKSGVINGTIFEIDGQIDTYKTTYLDLKVILTGGDMPYLQKSIKNQIFAAPNLVLIGLNKILNLNV